MTSFLDPYEAIDNLKAEIIILNELSFQDESDIEYQEFLQFCTLLERAFKDDLIYVLTKIFISRFLRKVLNKSFSEAPF